MKFFRSHSNEQLGGGGVGGVIVPAATNHHPSAPLVVDAHAAGGDDFRTADCGGEHVRRDCDAHVGPEGGDPAVAGGGDIAPPAKRALHLEEHEDRDDDDGAVEQIIVPPAAADPRSRPRSRLKFRLGRRSRTDRKASGGGCSSSEDEESDSGGSVGTRPSRMAGLRIRKAGRSSSLETPISSRKADDIAGMVDGRSEMVDRLSSSRSSRRSSRRAASAQSLADRLGSSERCVLPRTRREPQVGSCRRVTFARVSIREYTTVLGDHPCCPSGPPLSLGWTLEREEYSVEFERYELQRAPRRCKEEMRMGDDVRRDILHGLVVATPAAAAAAADEGTDNEWGESSAEECQAPAPAAVYLPCGAVVHRAEVREGTIREQPGESADESEVLPADGPGGHGRGGVGRGGASN